MELGRDCCDRGPAVLRPRGAAAEPLNSCMHVLTTAPLHLPTGASFGVLGGLSRTAAALSDGRAASRDGGGDHAPCGGRSGGRGERGEGRGDDRRPLHSSHWRGGACLCRVCLRGLTAVRRLRLLASDCVPHQLMTRASEGSLRYVDCGCLRRSAFDGSLVPLNATELL
jgi:hypothetical protein